MRLLSVSPFMTGYIYFITVLTGLVMGSFSNCLAERLCGGEKFVFSRSYCPKCHHTLSAVELIPLFSWIFHKGRCKHCKEKISVRYPLTELISAILFVAVVSVFDITPKTFEFLFLTVILLTAALVDMDSGIIPNGLIIAAIANFLIFTAFSGKLFLSNLINGFIGGLSISLPLLIFVLIYDKISKKESMGGGDIKLFFVLGLYFSWKVNLLMLILSCIIGILYFILYAALNHKKGTDVPFPFGPSIAAAGYFCILFGNRLITFYTNLFK
jgi:prepilin signal peptidase PulO-like enzyme (type II secretory pathway)